ncbi:hypothetical protein B0T18DRAFT_370246 [Schizothecium vesticola]|uniref:RING-type domain-containing protein n=1 Tax=Schizothecium vesticola TaxID=314040 RepID=A0AA40ENT9_9PEZI|nr:hypothetical protein B0T18DRAFT_370246 [Schizothecium vesticola]
MAADDLYDLLIVIDGTVSMSQYLESLTKSVQDIIRISSLTGCFSRLGVVVYRDYCGGPIISWSRWHSHDAQDSQISQTELADFVRGLRAQYGGDLPEATKTGLAEGYRAMRSTAKTIILLYSDAPPHLATAGGDNHISEQHRLKRSGLSGESAPLFADWVSGARTLRDGDKKAQVFSIISSDEPDVISCYALLSGLTGGVCLSIHHSPTPEFISELTLGLLLTWMGVEKRGATLSSNKIASVVGFKDNKSLLELDSETSEQAGKYIPKDRVPTRSIQENLTWAPLSMSTMAQFVPQRNPKIDNFCDRYGRDEDYRELVCEQMGTIIESDVAAITLNPVFGDLWRTICKDRSNPRRDELIASFGLKAGSVEGDKARMEAWLEESYDRAGEIREIIDAVPDDTRFPCVFLDPTTLHSGQLDKDDGTKLTRDDLMEIGRSCDPRVLRRLGRVLTHMTFVASEAELPGHMKGAGSDEVPMVPMALADSKNGGRFWNVLLHCVVPGTLLSLRPSALLAALAVRMGIKPLEEPAFKELQRMRNRWADLAFPETWNLSCLTLLLEADRKWEKRRGASANSYEGEYPLNPEDRRLFRTLVDYRLIELNLKTPLTAEISWRPDKAKMALGPVVVCTNCHYPRSVTVMASNGLCGLCDYVLHEQHVEGMTTGHVSKHDTPDTTATWVECAMEHCRVQYVVYFTENLNVRAKCHYCRSSPLSATTTKAPFLECTTCLSRVIYPLEYRPATLTTFTCPGCTSHKSTVTPTPTTLAALLCETPASSWLLANTSSKIPTPFSGRSLFHTISTAGIPSFTDHVSVLPSQDDGSSPALTLHSKPLHNTPSLLATVRSWLSSGTLPSQSAPCNLCFESTPRHRLRLACGGRRGCSELVCLECLTTWYGSNARGRIINAAALSCPFCRRQPTGRAKVPRAVKGLGNAKAVAEGGGRWVYAWCVRCGMAKEFAERVCAGGGADVEGVRGWKCEGCTGEGKELVVMGCPGCGLKTEKVGGCDHIRCPKCDVNWCFACGFGGVDGAEIYGHMTEAHGGWYNGRDYEEEEGEYEEEDEWEE